MRILLTANASYDPPKGGSTRANLAWLRSLAANGHACRVIAPTPNRDSLARERNLDGIAIRGVPNLQLQHGLVAEEIRTFAPDWVLVSSEDVAHVILRAAAHAAPGRLVYLAHTPQFFPFGPESWHKDATATEAIRRAAGVVSIGQHMAGYIREHLGREAAVIHPPIYGQPPYRRFGRFGSGMVLMVNPCAVKGISIFLALASAFPNVEFAALKGWGTTAQDRAALSALPNVRLLDTVPDIEDVLQEARCLLMPSVWYEGFGLIAMEAMLRGVPVIASDSGGLAEAKRGTDCIVPVQPVEKYEMVFDDTGMPRAIVPDQDLTRWTETLARMLNDETAYWSEAERSRSAALAFVGKLDAMDFERYLQRLQPGETHPAAPASQDLAARLAKLDPRVRASLLSRVRAHSQDQGEARSQRKKGSD
ncbi:MAG: glycosyltransferase [Bryobacteraceae bacterium]|nr:glycosyltransferase [Bryobacteraceae bacterium]